MATLQTVKPAAPAPVKLTDIHESIHTGHIPAGNAKGLVGAGKYMELTRDRDLRQIRDMQANPDPRLPPAANAAEIARFTGGAKTESQKAYDAAMKAIDTDITDNEAFLEGMGGFKEHRQGAEIRSVLRGMKTEQERQAFIGEAVEAVDDETLSAVLGAYPLTLGVSRDFMAAMKNRYLEKIAPDCLKLRTDLAKAKAALQAAHPHIMRAFDEAASGINKFQPQIAAAEAARKGFNA